MSKLHDAIAHIEAHGCTQTEAATLFGVAQSSISRASKTVRRGAETPSLLAVKWILDSKGRTQVQAAARFNVTQAAVSLAMTKHVAKALRPDGRRNRGAV